MARRSKTKPKPRRKGPSKLEADAVSQIKAAGLPPPKREYRFHPVRRWRFDFAWPEQKVALECDGAVYIRGRHARGAGIVKDNEKMNTALCMGWRVLKVNSPHLKSGEMIEWLKAVMA